MGGDEQRGIKQRRIVYEHVARSNGAAVQTSLCNKTTSLSIQRFEVDALTLCGEENLYCFVLQDTMKHPYF